MLAGMSDHPCRNMELKARLASLAEAEMIAREIATEYVGREHQVDTYFYCQHGRLKLREIDEQSATLISYCRLDDREAKPSDYRLVDVADSAALKQALAESLGVRCVVDKQRQVYRWQNVRIHLDDVTGLGAFLEFEAMLGPGVNDDAGRRQLSELSAKFNIACGDLLPRSYGDMMV